MRHRQSSSAPSAQRAPSPRVPPLLLATASAIASFATAGCASTDAAPGLGVSSSPLVWVPAERASWSEHDADGCERVPVVFVHGLGGEAADFDAMVQRLRQQGWPQKWLVARTLSRPWWAGNVAHAEVLRDWVEEVRRRTGQRQVDVVAHSMGNLSTRYFLHVLGGASVVRNYVSLGGMHQGLGAACTAPPSARVFRELCPEDRFLQTLNGAALRPGTVRQLSVAAGRDRVVPLRATLLRGAALAVIPDATHDGPAGLLEHPAVLSIVRDALQCRPPTPARDGARQADGSRGGRLLH